MISPRTWFLGARPPGAGAAEPRLAEPRPAGGRRGAGPPACPPMLRMSSTDGPFRARGLCAMLAQGYSRFFPWLVWGKLPVAGVGATGCNFCGDIERIAEEHSTMGAGATPAHSSPSR